MKTSSNNTESQTPSTSTNETEIKTDDYGYSHDEPMNDKVEEPENKEEDVSPSTGYDEEEKSAEVSKEENNEDDEETITDPSTGYDEEIKEEPEQKKDEKQEEKKEEDSEDDKVLTEESASKLLGDLGEGYDVESISKFAVEQKFSKEQLEAYVEFAKGQDQQTVKQHEARVKEQRRGWQQELRNDKDFSGQNGEDFKKSVFQVEKVLDEMMPNLKKNLTERGGMLPPYIMKDLLNLSRLTNPKDKLIGGDPSTPVKKGKGNFLDEMYE